MKTILGILMYAALVAQTVVAESVVIGWYANQESDPRHGLSANMVGPRARNATPKTEGVFRGEYRWHGDSEPKLEGLFRVSVDSRQSLTAVPVRFTITETGQPESGDLNNTTFATSNVAFDEGDAFLLAFRIGGKHVLVLLRIMQKTVAM